MRASGSIVGEIERGRARASAAGGKGHADRRAVPRSDGDRQSDRLERKVAGVDAGDGDVADHQVCRARVLDGYRAWAAGGVLQLVSEGDAGGTGLENGRRAGAGHGNIQ